MRYPGRDWISWDTSAPSRGSMCPEKRRMPPETGLHHHEEGERGFPQGWWALEDSNLRPQPCEG
jgi:hypothetical protein